MIKVRAFIFLLHRVTSVLICLFFAMWFVTGLVLIYRSFPNVSKQQKYEHMDVLPDSLPDIAGIKAQLPETAKDIKGLSLRQFQGQALFTVNTNHNTYTFCSDTAASIKPVNWETIKNTAKKWVDAPVSRIDTLNKREVWIMYSRYKREMPIYKFYYNDKAKHQLFIASRTGEVLQLTNKEQRFWAWVGSIPHKLYFPALRRNTETWILTLTIAGFIAMIAALSGMYVGIYILLKNYRARKKIKSPYKKVWYKWHHVAGLVFGVFMVTFAFSGAMALQRIPQWIIKTHGNYRVTNSQLRGNRLVLDDYRLDYRSLKNKYPNLKQVEWSYFQDVPIYNIVVGNREICIDASATEVKELYLPQSQIEKAIARLHGDNEPATVTMIDSYDQYYLSIDKKLPLPVYKVTVDNADKSCYYIDPKTGNFKYKDRRRRVKKWVFSGLHYFSIKGLVEHPILWTVLIWIVCFGGLLVCVSGVWLSFKYLYRRRKKSFGNKIFVAKL